ncbi:MAG TPA: DUF4241 domain-containing protein [Longimicrobium sp.]|jgi:hypothetical protein
MNRFRRLLRNLWSKPMPDVSDALTEGTLDLPDGTRVTLSLHPLGDLVLPTGQIVASDPFIADDPPYTRGVAPGRYPVLVNVALINTDSRVAYAILRFSRQRPVQWEMARYPKHDPATPGENEFSGYGVDSGAGCFIDAGAVRILVERTAADGGENQDLTQRMAETYVDTWSWVNYVLDPDTGANVIAFSAGWGDGVYPSFWGLDETGAPVCLLTDFRVFQPFRRRR